MVEARLTYLYPEKLLRMGRALTPLPHPPTFPAGNLQCVKNSPTAIHLLAFQIALVYLKGGNASLPAAGEILLGGACEGRAQSCPRTTPMKIRLCNPELVDRGRLVGIARFQQC